MARLDDHSHRPGGTPGPDGAPRPHERAEEEPLDRAQSSPEYQGGTDGNSALAEGTPRAPEEGTPGAAEEAPPTDQTPFWARLGFDSFDDYLAYLKRQQTLYSPLPRGTKAPVPAVPGAEVGDVGTPAQVRPLRRRQVNVKLRENEGADLDQAASVYGLAPSTLARLLVNRGVKAILDEYGGGSRARAGG